MSTPKELPRVRLGNGRVVLRPVEVDDYPFLRRVELSDDLLLRWRHRGVTPGPEEWVKSLWSGVLLQYIAISIEANEALGIITFYNADLGNGFVYLVAARFQSHTPSQHLMEGVVLLIEHVFSVWPFRKIYLEVPEYNLDQFVSSLESVVSHEGCLKEHWRLGGEVWDHHYLSIHRRDWETGLESIRRYVVDR
jgi:hypothetical protein